MVENPSVFALLARGKRTVVCGNGQPRLALLQLLELMGQAKIHVFYAGDLDPEGLLIAQNLKKRYTGIFSFWHMGLEDYWASYHGSRTPSCGRTASREKAGRVSGKHSGVVGRKRKMIPVGTDLRYNRTKGGGSHGSICPGRSAPGVPASG